jgi:hypothetical protein
MLRLLGGFNLKTLINLGFLGFVVFVNGCAEDTIEIPVTLSFNSTTDSNYVCNTGKALTVRRWYTYSGLTLSNGTPSNIVQPAGSVPQLVSNALDWSTASNAGDSYSCGDGSVIQLRGVPIGREFTVIAIEILAQLNDGKIHPIAFAIYDGRGPSLTADQLKSDLKNGIMTPIYAGRTCGTLQKVQRVTTPTDDQLKVPCL